VTAQRSRPGSKSPEIELNTFRRIFFVVEMASINIFKRDSAYIFKQYLGDPGLFKQLGDYYNGAKYRFEIPAADLEKVQDILQAAGYDIAIVDNPKEFVVTIGRFQKHKEILKNSVDVEEVGDDKIFLMKDRESVEMALSQGATKYEGDLFS
jgi:hypothetical protein